MSETQVNQNNNSLDDSLSATEPKVESNQNSGVKGNGAEVDDSSPNKRIKLSNDVNDDLKPVSGGRGRPSKTKRLNILEKTAKEGEVLLQNLGHKADDDLESTRRRTRSQTRGTPAVVATPPTPTKKAAPKSPTKDNSSSGTPKRRGRPPKNSMTNNNSVETKAENNETKAESNETTEESNESQEKTVNNSSETTNNTNDAKAGEQTNSTDAQPVADADPKESAEDSEQTNDVNNKTNSISDDTSKSVPIVDTQPVPQSD